MPQSDSPLSNRDGDRGGAGGAIAQLFVDNRHLLGLTILVLMVAGLSALVSLPRIEDPRITTRNAIILTPLPGASAERVEALVTKKLEDELKEVSEIKRIEATSRAGISVISLELADWVSDAHNEQIFSKIRDRLEDASRELPPAALKPQLDEERGAVAFSLITALSWEHGEEGSLGLLYRIAEGLSDRLRHLPGSDQVVLFGEPEEEITVTLDPEAVAALGLRSDDIAELIAAADAKISAGQLHGESRQLKLELRGALDSLQRIAAIPISQNRTASVVRLGDVATIERGWRRPPSEIAYADGRRALLVAVQTEGAIRLDQWAERARAVVDEFRQTLDPGVELVVEFDQSEYTEERLAGLGSNLLAGAAAVVLVVLITMGWRSALIVGSALPLSAAGALFGLTFFGEQIHQMSIFGMIIAIGLLIDNAIVMTDAVRERLRQGLAPREAVAEAIRHLFSPLFASTLTTILGFMPIFLLPGNVGDFIGPIAISVVLALITSFALSMSVIPALAAQLAPPSRADQRSRWWRDGLYSRSLTALYRTSLGYAMRHPLQSLLLTLVMPISGFWAAGSLPMQFFPPADRDQFQIELRMGAEASIEQSARAVRAVESAVTAHHGVIRLTWVVGGSSPPVYYNQLRNQDNNARYARGVVLTSSRERVESLIPVLQEELDERFPAAKIIVQPFGQGPPIPAPVAFRLVGEEPYRLRLLGDELRRIMHRLPEITHTRASMEGGEPKLWFQGDEDLVRLGGLTLAEVASQFQGSLDGRTGGSVLEDLEELPVRVRYGDDERRSLAQIEALQLQSSAIDGSWIPASALGHITLLPEAVTLTRRNGERVNNIEGFIRHGSLPIEVANRVMAEIKAEGFQLPPGYRLEVAGNSEEQGRAVGQLLTYVPVLFALMLSSLILSFRSVAIAGSIILVAALSVGLGMLSLWGAGFPLGFNPMLGSAGLIGVAINGSIVVLAAIRANPAARRGDSEAIVDEVIGATRHIFSTTLTTLAGFIPLLISGGQFWPPLAVVMAGGVGLAITLGLLLTPALYRLGAGLAPGPAGSAVGPSEERVSTA